VVFLALLAAGLSGCRQEETVEKKEVPRNVRVLELGATTMQEYFEISGPVAPVRGADLSAQESGPVVALITRKGQEVSAGEIIVEQERDILRAEKEAAAAALKTQAYNVDKVRQLHAAGKVSRIELLTAENTYAQAKSQADIASERYERAAIRAPFDGVVVDRYVELGQLVLPGQPVARVIDPYVLKLEAHLTGGQVQWVQSGDPATIVLGDGRQPATGTVTWIGFEADRMTGKFKVEIEIPNDDLHYNSGVIGRARLPKHVYDDVIAIPRDAVIQARTGPVVFVVEGDRARRRPLSLGMDQGLMVMVADGLDQGEQLVVRGHRELRDGSLVQITERATHPDGSLDSDPDVVTARGEDQILTTNGAADMSAAGSTEAGR
jgi:RND family efflux transporter MFP subunit